MTEYSTVFEVAELLQLSPETVRGEIKSGRLKGEPYSQA